jgi:division protein CdvB (Snf7/Vps24/ESCRT-III family)
LSISDKQPGSFEPLKPKIEHASLKLKEQIEKLDQIASNLKTQDDEVFSMIVSSLQENERERAEILARELSIMLKMSSMLVEAKLALEQLTLRLGTVKDIGDLAEAVRPSLDVIKHVKPSLATFVPDSEQEIERLSDLLTGTLAEARRVDVSTSSVEPVDEESEKAITEAVAHHESRHDLPLPNSSDSLEEAA